MKELINSIKKHNSDLIASTDELKLNQEKLKKIVEKLVSIINDNIIPFTSEELTYITSINKESTFLEEVKIKIDFILNVLIKNNFALDSSQKEVINDLVNIIKEKQKFLKSEINVINSAILENEEFVENLKEETIFTDFSKLLSYLEMLDFDYSTSLEIVKDIMLKNDGLTLSNKKRKQNSEEELISIMNSFGYDYKKLSEKSKSELINNCDINLIPSVLEALNTTDFKLAIGTYKDGTVLDSENILIKLLVSGKTDSIYEFKKLCDENDILNPFKIVETYPEVLIDKPKRKTKTSKHKDSSDKKPKNTEAKGRNTHFFLGDFKDFIELFDKRNVPFAHVQKKVPSILRINPNIIKENLELLEKFYTKINDDDEVTIDLLGKKHIWLLLSKNSIEKIDKLIEVSELGLKYAFNSPSSAVYNISLQNLAEIKISEELDETTSLIYSQSNGRVVKQKDVSHVVTTTAEEFLEKYTDEYIKKSLEISDEKNILYDKQIDSFEFKELNPMIFDNPFISFLEQNFKTDNMTYDINNTRISRQKVLRLCSILMFSNIDIGQDEILYCLTNESLLNEKDITNIKDFIFLQKEKKRGGKKVE